MPRYVVLLAMCAALNSCNLGYDIGVNSGVGPHLQAKGEGMHLSDLQLELFFGIFGLAAMLGAAVAYTASDGLPGGGRPSRVYKLQHSLLVSCGPQQPRPTPH